MTDGYLTQLIFSELTNLARTTFKHSVELYPRKFGGYSTTTYFYNT